MPDTWKTLEEWPELRLERLDDAGVARILLNRPDKRNCWNRPLCKAFLCHRGVGKRIYSGRA